MAYLHSRQVLHGDLKCENVLLAEAPESSQEAVVAKVADFGLSKSLATAQTHLSTQTHGTVTHMAPELLENGKLSRASDVYSFGILMWELVNRRRPFEVTQGQDGCM
jgi:serine/threonine protein kinase